MSILKNPKYQFFIFLILFFFINIIQSIYTGLLYDEAYYWIWSKKLSFGYFDHPPLVALWIKLGSFFFENELGVRFFSVISFTLMLYIIWMLIDVKDKWHYVWLYFLLIISVALLNIYGFVSTPDTPLLFFVSLFLLFYKKFLEKNSLVYSLLLGFSMAGMLYSKYHGILIILFVVISNYTLLKNRNFWIASMFGAILYIPHLYWQYSNDFITFKYHLFERGGNPYRLDFTIMHLVNQIAIVGITFPLIYYAFKQIILSKFDKALKYVVYGLVLFFLLTSYKMQPQAQWTGAMLIPLVVVSFRYFVNNENERKWLVKLGLIQLVLLLAARLLFAADGIIPIKLEPQIGKQMVSDLQKKTKDKAIIFINSFQNASLYQFYTNIETHSYSILEARRSQYDLGDFENKIQKANVYVVGREKRLPQDNILAKRGDRNLSGHVIQNYESFQKVTCSISSEELVFSENVQNDFEFKFTNNYNKSLNFENTKFVGVFYNDKTIITTIPIEITNLNLFKSYEEKKLFASLLCPVIQNKKNLKFRVAIQFYGLPGGYQGNKVDIKIIN